jgi:50S ribosomal protein L16 3-hydroxylase
MLEVVDLVAPLSEEEFLKGVWDRRTHISRGAPDRFAGLFDRNSFLRAAANPMVNLGAGRATHDGGHERHPLAAASDITHALADGFTVQLEHLERADERLTQLIHRVRHRLKIPGPMDVAGFLSPNGSGFGVHYDAVSMWVLQIEGEKTWHHGRVPAVEYPMRNFLPTRAERDSGARGYGDSATLETKLSAGDVMYLPAGTWHRPVASGESIHLCLSIQRATMLDFAAAILGARLYQSVDWRRLPTAADEIELFFTERLSELRRSIDALTVEQFSSDWRRRVES